MFLEVFTIDDFIGDVSADNLLPEVRLLVETRGFCRMAYVKLSKLVSQIILKCQNCQNCQKLQNCFGVSISYPIIIYYSFDNYNKIFIFRYISDYTFFDC